MFIDVTAAVNNINNCMKNIYGGGSRFLKFRLFLKNFLMEYICNVYSSHNVEMDVILIHKYIRRLICGKCVLKCSSQFFIILDSPDDQKVQCYLRKIILKKKKKTGLGK